MLFWITAGEPPTVITQLQSEPIFNDWQWVFTADPFGHSEFQNALLFIVDTDFDFDLFFLEKLKLAAPTRTRVLFGKTATVEKMVQAVNRGEVFSIIPKTSSVEVYKQIINDACIEAKLTDLSHRLLKDSSRQNRDLEKLTAELESRVEERTVHIQISKDFEEEKVSRLRGLIRFIQQLSLCSSYEELIELLRRDLRTFHQVHDPVLIFETDARGPQIVFWRQSRVQTRAWPHPMEFAPHIHLQDPEMSKLLANYFARPFAKALVIPIECLDKTLIPEPVFHLILENSLPESEINQVLDFCLERIQPLMTAIERIRIETELTHFSYRWEKTFDGLKDPIAIIDRSDRVLRANKKFSDHLIKKNCYQSFANQDERCEGCPVPKVLETGLAQKGEIRRGNRTFEVNSYPISLVQGGMPTNVVNQYVDLTQSREIYMRLLQSEKMGALGLLAGNIAHELNNPLTGLRSLAQVLRAEQKNESQISKDLFEIEKATERCQKIIRNLLDFVYDQDHKLTEVNLDDLVEKTLPFLKTAMRMHRLQKDLKATTHFVLAEPQLLQQVIFNLVHNACQAMEKQGVLTIRTEVFEQRVRLWVQDTGPGIDSSLLVRIFDPFFTTKKEGAGTGLGLSLSKEIIESFHGQIGVDSVLGQGASFWFDLPLVFKEPQ